MPVWAAPRVGLLLFVICAVALGFSTPWLGPSSWDSPFVDPTLSRSLLNHRPDTASAARNHHQVPEHHEPATDGLPTGAGQVPHTSTSTNRTRSFSHPVGGAGGDGDIHAQLLSSTPPRPAFDHVYVVSLPSRQDRRDQMRQIAAALQLNITFIDATLSSDPKITWIAEHVYDVRQQKAKHLLSTARGKSRADQQEPEVGGMGVGSVWLAMDGQRSRRGKTLHLPPIPNWVAALYEAVDADRQLHPQDPHFDVTAHLRDPIERIESRQLNAAVLSTWFSHVEAWRLMQRNADKAALFLEDDIDMEWDFAARWASIDSKLPPDWHSVFAGHCWGREMTCAGPSPCSFSFANRHTKHNSWFMLLLIRQSPQASIHTSFTPTSPDAFTATFFLSLACPSCCLTLETLGLPFKRPLTCSFPPSCSLSL